MINILRNFTKRTNNVLNYSTLVLSHLKKVVCQCFYCPQVTKNMNICTGY